MTFCPNGCGSKLSADHPHVCSVFPFGQHMLPLEPKRKIELVCSGCGAPWVSDHRCTREAAAAAMAAGTSPSLDFGSYPDDNPKTQFGVKKTPYDLVPNVGIEEEAWAFQCGANKYGAYNWREKTISSSVYYAAIMRHMKAWFDGEDLDPESGRNHLGHVRACCNMILDGALHGKLNDNRPSRATKETK